MATAIQRRRGTAAQHSSFTGLAGEITIDTTNNTVVVHDGSTAGGHRLAKYSEITSLELFRNSILCLTIKLFFIGSNIKSIL